MKHKLLIITLSIFILTSCKTENKDDAKLDVVEETTEQAEVSKEQQTIEKPVEAKPIQVEKKENTEKEKKLIYTSNEVPIDEILKIDIDMDISTIDDKTLLNAYNKPCSRYEKYLSDNAKNASIEEEYIADSIRANIGQDLLMVKDYGIEISSMPVFSAINSITNSLDARLNEIDKTITSYGIVSEYMRIKDFNAFLDPEVANIYSQYRSITLTPQRVLEMHYYTAGIEQDPLNRFIIRYTGEVDPVDQFVDELPGDIKAYTFLSLQEDGTAAYITYLADKNDSYTFPEWVNNMWTMPLNAFYMEMEVYGEIKYSPFLHLVTGTGFDGL